jgi:hypothetical protein
MKKIEIQWKPLNKPPKESGYVLLAITHHKIPAVVMGFCKIHRTSQGVHAEFMDEVYHGNGVAITHYAKLPPHPYAQEDADADKQT